MVSTASAAAQANELEKKRKQTLERAKANHLSRQLQMRLQYARLKVEHGWQRQNLNEVENLYFHHSHQRSPKPCPPNQADPMPVYTTSRHYPSYRSWLESQSKPSVMNTLPESRTQETTSTTFGKPTPGPPTPAVQPLSASGDPSTMLRTSSTPPVTLEAQATLPPQNPPPQTPVPEPSLSSGDSSSGAQVSSRASVKSVPTSASTSEITITTSSSQPFTNTPFAGGSTSYVPTALTPTPMTLSSPKKSGLLQKGKSSSSAAVKDMFSMNTSSLTYDSFWSGLQSKSYPSLKGGGTTNGAAAAVSATNGSLDAGLPHAPAMSFAPLSPAPASSIASAPIIQPTSTSTPPVLASAPQVQASTSSSSASSSTASSVTSSTVAPVPTAPLPAPTPQSQPPPTNGSSTQPVPSQPQIQMTMPVRYENFVPWSVAPAQIQPLLPHQQHPQSQHLISTPFLANPAAFPFLANLSASYVQAFGHGGVLPPGHQPGMSGVDGISHSGASSQGVGVGVNGVNVVGPGQSASLNPSPVASGAPIAFVGQQES